MRDDQERQPILQDCQHFSERYALFYARLKENLQWHAFLQTARDLMVMVEQNHLPENANLKGFKHAILKATKHLASPYRRMGPEGTKTDDGKPCHMTPIHNPPDSDLQKLAAYQALYFGCYAPETRQMKDSEALQSEFGDFLQQTKALRGKSNGPFFRRGLDALYNTISKMHYRLAHGKDRSFLSRVLSRMRLRRRRRAKVAPTAASAVQPPPGLMGARRPAKSTHASDTNKANRPPG